MTELNFFGYVATSFILLGTFFSVSYDYYGWVLRGFGSLVWAYIGLRLGFPALWFSELVFAVIAYYGYKAWKKEHDAQLEFVNMLLEEEVDPLEELGDRLVEQNRREMKIMDGTIKFTKFGVEYDVEDFEFGAYLDHVTNGQD